MQNEALAEKIAEAKARTRPARKGPWRRLLASMQGLADGHIEVIGYTERPWTSVTFSGVRYRANLKFAGSDACEAAEVFVAELADHEFDIAGQLVADAAVLAVNCTVAPERRTDVEIELLLLEDV